MNGNIMVETRHKVSDTGIVTVSNTMGLHKKATLTSFCLQYLSPPCWRYTLLLQCNVVNLWMHINCCVWHIKVEIHGLRERLVWEFFQISAFSSVSVYIKYAPNIWRRGSVRYCVSLSTPKVNQFENKKECCMVYCCAEMGRRFGKSGAELDFKVHIRTRSFRRQRRNGRRPRPEHLHMEQFVSECHTRHLHVVRRKALLQLRRR